MCLGQAITNTAICGDVGPGSSLEWHYHDVTALTPHAFAPPRFPLPPHVLLYAYLGPRQLEGVVDTLQALVVAGARVVTYGHHLTFPPGAEGVETRDAVAGLLKVYFNPALHPAMAKRPPVAVAGP